MNTVVFLRSRAGQSGRILLLKEDTSMTTVELRAAAGELLHLHERFTPLFGRKEPQLQSLIYLNGLLLAPGRKSAIPLFRASCLSAVAIFFPSSIRTM